MEDFKYKGLSAEEWEELANPIPATDKQLEELGLLEQENSETKTETNSNKLYETADKLGIEHPEEGKEYEKLSVGETLKDVGLSIGVEASHLFAPKSKEWQYESKTKVGESFKYGYRYLAGTASLFLGGGWIGGAIKGTSVVNKASKTYKLGSGIQKLFSGTDIIKTGAKANLFKKAGAKFINATLGGTVSGAIADYILYRPEDNEGHLADIFGQNEYLEWLQSDDNDTEAQAKFKNVLEGFILGMGVGNAVEFGIKPLFGSVLKNIKRAAKATTAEEAEEALRQVALDDIKVEKLATKADMLEAVENIKNEAGITGEEGSQLIIDRLPAKDLEEAQAMLKVLEDGEEIFMHEDGTWDISINNWKDAYKVSEDEYRKQMLARDKAKADTLSNTPVYVGDTALKQQNDAVRHTWENRGWIGTNEDLNKTTATKIIKNYKDKLQIDNNISVEFVDGLMVEGKQVDGNTKATAYLGKKSSKKRIEAKADIKNNKKRLKEFEDKLSSKMEYITMSKRGHFWKVNITDPMTKGMIEVEESLKDIITEIKKNPSLTHEQEKALTDKFVSRVSGLPEEIQEAYYSDFMDIFNIAEEYAKNLELSKAPSETLHNIVIQIDKNAKNPYATLRAEIEHARDIATSEVPDQSVKHFSRYNGMNEGDVAVGYTYKKSVGRHKAVDNIVDETPTPAIKEEKVIQETTPEEAPATSSIAEKQTVEEVVNDVVSGDLKVETSADIEEIINKADEFYPNYNRTFEEIAKDSERVAKIYENAAEEDLEALKQAFFTGDIRALDILVRKEMAATKILSILSDKIEELGKNAPIETQRNICDMVTRINNYVNEARSGAGALLNSQKLVNRALATFGSMRLSELTKQGIQEFADLLDKEIKEMFNLKFTKGEQLNINQMKESIYNKIASFGDGALVDLLTTDSEFAKAFNQVIDNLLKTHGKTDIQAIYKELEDLITMQQYKDVYNAALLAPKTEGKIKTITNWTSSQGGIASYYVHNLLSGMGSLLKNVGSGFMNTAYFPARKILGGFLGGGEVMSKEGWNTYKVMLSNWSESWQMMKQAFLQGEGKLTNLSADTLNLEDGVFKGFHEMSDDNLWHKIQNFHSVMTRAMGATDEFMSQLNYRSICKAKCLNQADKMAELAGMSKNEEWINTMADKLFKKKFDREGKPLDIEAYNEAKTILYQNNLSGKMFNNLTGEEEVMREQTAVMRFAELLNNEANKCPFVKFIFPFVKTGANILQMNLDHNGLYAVLSPAQRRLLLSQTPEGALARSQIAFGTFSLALGTMMAANGVITGSAPTDKKERKALFETGWRPYSVKVTNPIDGNSYWVSYQGYEPIHTMLGFAADCFNIGQSIITPEDEQNWVKFSQQVGAALINNFIDKAAFRTGLKQLSILTDPENVVDWEKAMAQTAQGFLPMTALVKNVSSIGEKSVTQPKTMYERLFNSYFNRGLGDYRRDVFGDRQDIYGLLVTTAGRDGDEPEYQELARLAEHGYSPSDIGTVLSGTKLKFKNFKDPETGRSAYDAMQEELSTITIGGKTLKEAINELVTNPDYQAMPDGIDNEIKWSAQDDTKVNALNDIFRDYNEAAKEEVLNSNSQYVDKNGRTLQEAQEELEIEKMNKILNQNLDGTAEKIRSMF